MQYHTGTAPDTAADNTSPGRTTGRPSDITLHISPHRTILRFTQSSTPLRAAALEPVFQVLLMSLPPPRLVILGLPFQVRLVLANTNLSGPTSYNAS